MRNQRSESSSVMSAHARRPRRTNVRDGQEPSTSCSTPPVGANDVGEEVLDGRVGGATHTHYTRIQPPGASSNRRKPFQCRPEKFDLLLVVYCRAGELLARRVGSV